MSDAHTDLEMERPPAGACGQASIGVVMGRGGRRGQIDAVMGSRGGTGAATAIAVPVWTAAIRRGVSSTEAIDSSLVRASRDRAFDRTQLRRSDPA